MDQMDQTNEFMITPHPLPTNAASFDVESTEIRKLLGDPDTPSVIQQKDVVGIDTDTRGSVVTLDSKIAAACRSMVSPIHRIPPELLCTIFSHSLPNPIGKFANEPWNSLDTTQVPSVLAEVCSTWRVVSLAHFDLWSRIHINLEILSTIKKAPPTLSRLHLFLQRSGSHPLFVCYKDRCAPFPEATDLFLLLLSHSHRWREATFVVEFPRLQLMDRIRGHVPLLRSLDLQAYGANTFPVFRAFEEAPQLEKAILDVGDPYILSLPWSQLTSIEGRFNPSIILQRLPALLECAVHSDISTPLHTYTRHLKLRRLCIYFLDPLDWLETPNLEHLHVVGPNRHTSPHLNSFIRRCSCSLRSLTLSFVMLDSRDMHDLLASIPTLLRLHFTHCRIDWRRLARRLSVYDDSSIVPNLRHITILYNSPNACYGSIIGMLEARTRVPDHAAGVTRLVSAYLLDMQLPPEDEIRLSALQDIGLKITRGDEPSAPDIQWHCIRPQV